MCLYLPSFIYRRQTFLSILLFKIRQRPLLFNLMHVGPIFFISKDGVPCLMNIKLQLTAKKVSILEMDGFGTNSIYFRQSEETSQTYLEVFTEYRLL